MGEHPQGTGESGRQEKIHAAKAPTSEWRQWETNGRPVKKHAAKAPTVWNWQERKPGDKCKIMRPGHAPLSKE